MLLLYARCVRTTPEKHNLWSSLRRTWRLASAMRSGWARRSQQGPLMRRLMSSASRLVCPPPMTFTKLSPVCSKQRKLGQEVLRTTALTWHASMLLQHHGRPCQQCSIAECDTDFFSRQSCTKRTGHVHDMGGRRGGGHLHFEHPLLAVRHFGVLVERPAPLPGLHGHLETPPCCCQIRRPGNRLHFIPHDWEAPRACEAVAPMFLFRCTWM